MQVIGLETTTVDSPGMHAVIMGPYAIVHYASESVIGVLPLPPTQAPLSACSTRRSHTLHGWQRDCTHATVEQGIVKGGQTQVRNVHAWTCSGKK